MHQNALSSEQVECYRQDGFVSVPGLLSDAQIETSLTEIENILARVRNEVAEGKTETYVPLETGVFVGLSVYSSFFRSLMRSESLLDIVECLIGPNIGFLSDKVVCKSSDVGWGSPWHQDWPYWRGAHKLSVWIALDAAGAENGCLMMMPGSHKKPVDHKGGKVAAPEGFIHRVHPEEIDKTKVVTLPAQPGDGIFFHDLTLHASHPNQNGKPRRALIITYRNAGEKDLDYPDLPAAQLVRGVQAEKSVVSKENQS